MSVTVTVNLAGSTHTLPTSFFAGSYVATNSFGDFTNATFKSFLTDIPFELMRTNVSLTNSKYAAQFDDSASSDWSGIDSQWDRTKRCFKFFNDLWGTKWLPNLLPFPASILGSGSTAHSVGTVTASTDGRSPQGHVDWVKKWQTIFGSDSVFGVENINEPTAPAWYNGITSTSDVRKGCDWYYVHNVDYVNAKNGDVATSGLPWYGMSYAKGGETKSEETNEINRFLNGTIDSIVTPNYNVSEAISVHLYPTLSGTVNSSEQSSLNSILYPTFTSDKGGMYAALTSWRALADALNPSLYLAQTEIYSTAASSAHANDSQGALEEIVRAGVAAKYQAAWKLLSHAAGHSVSAQQYGSSSWVSLSSATTTPKSPEDNLLLKDTTANIYRGRNVRAQALVDFVGPMLTQYKVVLDSSAITVTSAGTSPGGAASNGVATPTVFAHKKADGTSALICVANVDLTNSYTVNISWGVQATGSVTGVRLSNTQICGDACPAMVGLPSAGATSYTLSAAAGEAYLIYIPTAPPTQTLDWWLAKDAQIPSSGGAQRDLSNAHRYLAFDATADEECSHTSVLPAVYAGEDIFVTFTWSADTSTDTGTVCTWSVQFERVNALDIDGDSFATAKTVSAAPTADGTTVTSQVSFTSSEIDGIGAGDTFRVKVKRVGSTDTMTGDARLLAVELSV